MTLPSDTLGDALLAELVSREEPVALAVLPPPAQAQATYTPEVMVELMVQHPGWSHKQFAEFFGRPVGWFSTVLANDTFQQALDLRRHEVANPELTATLEERIRALSLRAVTVLHNKLDTPGVSDLVVLKGAELGLKALAAYIPTPPDPTDSPRTGANAVAERLMAAMEKMDAQKREVTVIEVQATEV